MEKFYNSYFSVLIFNYYLDISTLLSSGFICLDFQWNIGMKSPYFLSSLYQVILLRLILETPKYEWKKFTRIHVEIKITQSLKQEIFLAISYENLPPYCYQCGRLCHKLDHYSFIFYFSYSTKAQDGNSIPLGAKSQSTIVFGSFDDHIFGHRICVQCHSFYKKNLVLRQNMWQQPRNNNPIVQHMLCTRQNMLWRLTLMSPKVHPSHHFQKV